MKRKLSIGRVAATVIAVALGGMVLGGLFGLAAGYIAPKLFETMVIWTKLEPVGTAVVLGGTAGVLCGGALGAFAVAVQLVSDLLAERTP
ncbi:MAG: hypothetical protein WD294_05155 [Phycisphaeraceae bacterium]